MGDEASENVEGITAHRAKGLEYPIIVVADRISKLSFRGDALLDHAPGLA